MAEKDKRYYWLKLKRDFFKRHDIQIIENMPNGKDYILFYLKLLCESVDHDGNLRFSEQIPYDENMLATITNTNVDMVRSAIKIFTQLHMMDVMDDGTFYMTEVRKMLGSETYWAQKKRAQRVIETKDVGKCPTVSNQSPTCPSKRKDKDKDKEKEKECGEDESPTHTHGTYNNVILTEKELQALKTEFPDFQSKIDRLSEYMKSSGKTYDDHYATICMWAKEDAKKGRKEMVPDWMNKKPRNAFNGHSDQSKYDFDALEKELFDTEPKTAGNDPELAARAEALKKKFGGA